MSLNYEDLVNLPAFDNPEQASSEWQEPDPGFKRIEGTFDLQIVYIESVEKSTNTETGKYTPSLNFQVIGGPHDGHKINFVRFSPKWFYQPPKGAPPMSSAERKARPANTSQALNLLKALGYTGNLETLPRLAIDFDALLRQYDGAILPKVRIRLEGYCKACEATTVRGARNFKGGTVVDCPGLKTVKVGGQQPPGQQIPCKGGPGTQVEAQERIAGFTYPKAVTATGR